MFFSISAKIGFMIAGMVVVHDSGTWPGSSTQILKKDEMLFIFHQKRDEMHTCLSEILQLHSSEGSAALAFLATMGESRIWGASGAHHCLIRADQFCSCV